MQRFFITIANGALLAVVFIGIPAAAGVQFRNWQISSVPIARTLVLWGLALATAANAGAALLLLKGRKERKFCWEWAAVFGALLGAEYAFIRGWINFHWLKQILLWLQSHL